MPSCVFLLAVRPFSIFHQPVRINFYIVVIPFVHSLARAGEPAIESPQAGRLCDSLLLALCQVYTRQGQLTTGPLSQWHEILGLMTCKRRDSRPLPSWEDPSSPLSNKRYLVGIIVWVFTRCIMSADQHCPYASLTENLPSRKTHLPHRVLHPHGETPG